MADEIDLRPVTHITVDAIGPPGKRVFYVQGQQDTRTVTLIVEKFQIQSLAVAIEQFLAEIQKKFSSLHDPSPEYIEENMRINPPVDPLFRIGDLALGYENEADLVILIAREVGEQAEETIEEEDNQTVRFWCTRSQMHAVANWGLEVVSRGRPTCPQCGAPIDPVEGHFCPKKNGHRG